MSRARGEPLPGHDPGECTDYSADLDIGELAPGHRLVMRGVCLHEDRLWLHYAWVPGITEAQGEDSGVWLNVEYSADVLPGSLDYIGSYDASGGPSSEGEIGYERPPQEARRVYFDFFTTSDDRAMRVTVDLATGQILSEN